MLGKLLKYEYRASYKLYLVLYAIALALAGIARLLSSFNYSHNIILASVTGLFVGTVALSCVGLYFATLIFVLFRFYKHLFTDEGYLTFTLPVTPMKIIVSKIIVGMTWIIGSILVIIGAIFILLYGTKTLDNIKMIWNIIGRGVYDAFFDGEILQFIFWIVNYAIGVFSTVCFIYLAVAFGQLMMPRHKVGGSILAYFMVSAIKSLVTTMILILYFRITGFDLSSNTPPDSYYLCTSILSLILCTISIGLTNMICKKHLNLL